MRKLVVIVTLMAFILPAVLSFAASDAGPQQAGPKIKCCYSGQCLETLKENCEYKQGIVVPDCSRCPGGSSESTKAK